ncbi:hypothetical protein [Haloarchaeobius litoreus]|uniref:Uncharacterized protein n=1 Tax=Haloarchaeobius litoreus TaxID=755306 RepID=A0ABD6DFC4_9EURY|nr:hypothetical protein [Haloarchaeobius litoreus]
MSMDDEGNELPPFGIGVRDDELVGTPDDPGHLDRWLRTFRDAWATGATRSNSRSIPAVPHVGRAGTTTELSEILSMTATANGYQSRRYLAHDGSLANLLGLDTTGVGLGQTPGEDGAKSFTLDVLDMYEDTVMEALVGRRDNDSLAGALVDATDEQIADVVKQTMTNFRIMEWEWNPATGTFVRPDDEEGETANWNDEVTLGTNRSKALQKHRDIIRSAVENALTGEAVDVSALDVRVTNLLFQDLDNEDDVVPVVDAGVQDHLRALLTEDYDTVRKMGTQLEYDDDGSLSNEFKKETYLDVTGEETVDLIDRDDLDGFVGGGGHGGTRTNPQRVTTNFHRSHVDDDGEEVPLFTEHATLENIGDPAYSLVDGDRPLANYRPETPIYRQGMAPSDLWGTPETFSYEGPRVWQYYAMRQRRARFEKLDVLHRLGSDARYDENPAVLRSLAHHLFRFSLMRAHHSAALRTFFLDGQATLDSASEFVSSVLLELENESFDDGIASVNDFLDPVTAPDIFDDYHPGRLQTPFDLGSVDANDDPRLEQVGHSLRYLQSRGDDTIDRLVRGTLDLASHRFDAWETSLATRRLAEHRHDQGNWYQPEPVTYRDGGENVWQDTDAYVPPGEFPEWPPESPRSEAGGDDDDGASAEVSDDADGRNDAGETDARDDARDGIRRKDASDVTDGTGLAGDTGFDFGGNDDVSELFESAEYAAPEIDQTYVEGLLSGGNDLVSEPSTEQVSPSVPLPESSAGIHVGAWGYVEDLHPDDTDDTGEFLHAPSLEQATTAAVLRGGHRAFENEDEGHLSAVDLSAGRARIAKQLLEGVREGQPLGALLGYRFERGLHEAGEQQYIQNFRQAYPTFTGTLGGPASSGEAARSDVVDGYRLYRSLTFDDATHTVDPRPPRRPEAEARPDVDAYADLQGEHGLPSLSNDAVLGALWHLFEAVDAVRDTLTAESVHQFTQGNYSRATGSLEALANGNTVPEPQVLDTPRTSVGLTHRLLVTFGDADGATTPTAWTDDTAFTHPRVDAVGPGDGPDDETAPAVPAVDANGAFPLQTRSGAEPNLDAWVGELLPDPADVGCEAAYRWTEEREFTAGSFRTPASDGRVSVTDVGFEPDVVVFTASVAAAGPGEKTQADDTAPTVHGWGHGSAKRGTDGSLTQQSVSAVYDTETGTTVGTADTDDALHLSFAGDDGDSVRGTVSETTTDGFEFDVTVQGTDRAVSVDYLALSVTDPGLVSVGHLETQSGSSTEPLGIDADTVVLTATDAVDASALGTQGATTAATGGSVGLSYGQATTGGNGLTQHALSLSQDPSGGTAASGTAREDRVVHLDGDWSLSCTGLGTDLQLNAVSTGSAPRPVTYVAIESPPDEPTPEVGVLADGENTLASDSRPGAIEFVALPGVTDTDMKAGTAVSLTDATTGLGHGLTTGVGRQRAMADTVTDGTVAAPSGAGSVVDIPTGPNASVTVEVKSVRDGSFTVEFTEGTPADCLVCYRVWPAEPVEREFVADTTLTFDELLLSPLDAVAFSKEGEDQARTQLEQRLAYYLRRNRETKPTTADTGHPPIPADATVDLRFREDGGARVSAADFLELVRTVRDTLADGRPATADDLAHPAEQTGPGYDEQTFAELHGRGDAAAAALADVTALVDNRRELLDPDVDPTDAKETPEGERDEPTVTEQVEHVQDAVAEFRAQVPVSGVEEACTQVDDATAADGDVLTTELERLLRALPAGPTDPKDVREELTVQALAGRTLRCETDLDEVASLDVTVLGDTGADVVATGLPVQYVEQRTVQTDADGVFTVDIDCHGCTPGAPFLVVASSGGTVVYSERGRFVEPRSVHVVDPDTGGDTDRDLTGLADVPPGAETPITVTVTSDQAGDETTAFDTTVSTTTQDDGRFGVTLDASDVAPGTAFSVTATDGDGDTVYTADGHVRNPAYDVDLRTLFEGLTLLPTLCWLGSARPALDPDAYDSPAGALQSRLSNDTDWPAITAEADLVRNWKAEVDARSTGSRPAGPALDVSDDDVAVLAELTDLSALDLRALADTLATALEPLAATGLVDAVDVTGGEDRVDDARFWPTADHERLARVRTALAQLLRNPADRDRDDELLRFAAEFVASVERVESQAARASFVHLLVLFEESQWAAVAFDDAVDDPAAFLERLRRFVHYPETATDADRSGLDADLAALAAYYRDIDGLPGHRQAVQRAKALRDVLDRNEVERRMRSPDYDIAVDTTDRILALLDELPDCRDEHAAERVFEAIEEPLDELEHVDHVRPTERAVKPMVEALERLREAVDDSEPWSRFERFDERFEDVEAELGVDGRESSDATPSTEFVAVCGALRTTIDRYEEHAGQQGTAPVFRPVDARNGFDGWWRSTTGSLATEVDTELAPLAAVARSTRLDETFRHCVLETLRIPLLRASYFGVYASSPRSATGGRPEDERTLVAQARGVSDRLHARLDEAGEHADAVTALVPGAADNAAAATTLSGGAAESATVTEAAEHELDRLTALFGEGFVVLPPLSPPNQAELSKTFATTHTDELLSTAAPMETESWLQRAARVRDRPANLQQTFSYAEMVSGRLLRDDLRVGQLPYRETDDWVGIDGLDETPERGQVSMVTTFPTRYHADHPIAPSPGDADGTPGAQVAGFLVDDWREAVPKTEEKTGVAVNYDDPSTEPPQSILLAVPPADGGDSPWSEDLLLRTILESVDLAKLRGVDLNVVGKPRSDPKQRVLGQLLPAITLPHNTRDVPDSPTVDLDLDRWLADDLAGGDGGGGA